MFTVRVTSGTLLSNAASMMLIALICQNITLASGDYGLILLVAIVTMCIADACCAIVFTRGGWMRWAALAVASPSLMIIMDVLRRAPHVLKSV